MHLVSDTVSTDRIGTSRNPTARVARCAGPCTAFASLSLAACVLAAGCSAPRTWPSVTGESGLSSDAPPLPQVVISALKYAHAQIAKDAPLVYNLPEQINEPAFATFERGLAPGKPMCPGDTNVWTVRSARIDGSKAQVDVEYPSRDGFYQTVTVHLQGASGGFDYKPAYLQYWKVPVKEPACQQPLSVVARTCGAAAADELRARRAAAAPKPAAERPVPPAAAPVSGGEEPSK
jgi:hypothetical protein